MYIYAGKLNWPKYADNECITVVFPGGFALQDPVSVYWQWTVDNTGKKQSNYVQQGFITSVTTTTTEYSFKFKSLYTFEGTVSDDFGSLSLTMSDAEGAKTTMVLPLKSGNAVSVPSTTVFTGKLNWFNYCQNEMATLIFPTGSMGENEPVVLSYQWTKVDSGNTKVNNTVVSTIKDVTVNTEGLTNASFSNEYYTFDFHMPKAANTRNDIMLSMTNPNGDKDSSAPYTMSQTDFRDLGKKKALIMRFGTGSDQGIFLVKNMLVDHLGFAETDVELSYFDDDVFEDWTTPRPRKSKHCSPKIDPPTAANFQSKLQRLCQGAVAGDVRFLYIDAQGTHENKNEEPDGKEEGWIFAGSDEGITRGVVYDNWLGDCIRKNLAKGVNLTILTSSRMGGGMPDTHTATPGILLAGCHETQLNVKALNGMDPWMYGIVSVIKKCARKEGVPIYEVLFNRAKSFVREQLRQGQLSPLYRGPSPDENNPVPMKEEILEGKPRIMSNQDPQMVFYSGYIKPGVERFLFPFETASGGNAVGYVTRFPKDEYPKNTQL